jgi:hypothetical protein
LKRRANRQPQHHDNATFQHDLHHLFYFFFITFYISKSFYIKKNTSIRSLRGRCGGQSKFVYVSPEPKIREDASSRTSFASLAPPLHSTTLFSRIHFPSTHTKPIHENHLQHV